MRAVPAFGSQHSELHDYNVFVAFLKAPSTGGA